MSKVVDVREDQALREAMERAIIAMAEAGITTEDILNDLPAISEELMRKRYGNALVDEMQRQKP